MIISASRRTDIPAFYSKWFIDKIRKGFFVRINPYNPKDQKRISLKSKDVECFVFWTKNPENFIPCLDELDQAEYHYYFQYTLNHYPDCFEPKLPSYKKRINTFKNLSSKIGKDRMVLRYDPIIISNLTPFTYHLQKIEKLMNDLKDDANHLVFSFIHFYEKTKKHLNYLKNGYDLKFLDIYDKKNSEFLERFLRSLKELSEKYGLEISSCAQIDKISRIISSRACIDGDLIQKITGLNQHFKRDRGQRENCLCVKSVDMGAYQSCPHLCAYCYANTNFQKVLENHKKHKFSNDFLI